jgi:hypothetical protein
VVATAPLAAPGLPLVHAPIEPQAPEQEWEREPVQAQKAAPPIPQKSADLVAGPPPLAPPLGWSPAESDLGPGWELGDVPTDLENDIPIPEGLEALVSEGDDAPPTPGDPMPEANELQPGTFGAALEKNKKIPRATFVPHPPPVHPQMRDLQADPFGGLTLEPPASGPSSDADNEDDEEGAPQ